MKTLAYYLLFLSFLFSCSDNKEGLIVKNGLLIEQINIISPDKKEIQRDAYILIQEDSIYWIGEARPKINGDYQTIDGNGKYLIPGLLDGHVHITQTNGLSEEEEQQNPELSQAFRAQLPKSYLYYGYTTLIDLGASDLRRLKDFQKADLGPDLYYVGGGVVIGNGYGLTNWSDEHPNFVYLESDAENIPQHYSKEDHSPAEVVRRIAESGAIAVKSYYEPGFDPSQPRMPVPTEELIQNLLVETHRHGLILAAHGNSLEAHQFLGNAGVDMIAHGLWNWGEFQADDQGNIPDTIKATLDQEVDKEIGYNPTLQVIKGLRAMTEEEFLEDPKLLEVLPKEMITFYKSNKERMYAEVFGDAPPEVINRVFTGISKKGQSALKYLSDQGGIVLFGTDTPSSPTYGNPPGYNGFLEMKGMQEAGLSLEQILASATINNAKAFGLEDKYGSIEEGKKANLLLLDKNPLEDIEAYDAISSVILSGKNYERSSFLAK